MPNVSLAILTYEEFMQNDRLTYSEFTHSVLGKKFDDYEIIINTSDNLLI